MINKTYNEKHYLIGIQGGKGSFNEEAVNYYLKKHKITNYKIKYLHTTEKVLQALERGEINYGQFAIHNSTGGIVQESLSAMVKHKFTICDQYSIKIAHTLMIRCDAKLSDIDTILTHPQVLAQCAKNLSKKYPNLKQLSGNGKLIDQAHVAQKMSEKKLGKNIATIGSKILAQIYNLSVIENNLQDTRQNYTSFLIVKKR